jgi:triacylglycerol lipase
MAIVRPSRGPVSTFARARAFGPAASAARALLVGAALASCTSGTSGASDDTDAGSALPGTVADAGAPTTDAGASLTTTLTPDFEAWLAANGYAGDDFVRRGTGGSFGGRAAAGEALARTPIVFVHGNSDSAVGRVAPLLGWDAARRDLAARGWADRELYGLTWGPADPNQRLEQVHGGALLRRVRRFLEAVRAYTGAPKIAVVAHSMGVTLARKAIEGGTGTDDRGVYDLGAPLTASVDTFLGIAGANLGLVGCYRSAAPTCSPVYGFFPGNGANDGLSEVLARTNATRHDEGARVFSLCSSSDEVIGFNLLVWGQNTCRIPGEDRALSADGTGHFALRDTCGPLVASLVATHAP